jgi:hypothetical protein
MINPNQFINLILEPALRATNTYSIDSMHLMAVTLYVESKFTHLKQLPNGPALGFGEIEMPTYLDCARYLEKNNPTLLNAILKYVERSTLPKNPVNIMGDLSLNVLIARVKYWMLKEPIPSYKDVSSQAQFYKRFYNTGAGAATPELFIAAAKDLAGYINHEPL